MEIPEDDSPLSPLITTQTQKSTDESDQPQFDTAKQAQAQPKTAPNIIYGFFF